jgi:hypothetical protein
MKVVGMHMLRWKCDHTIKDRIRNEIIREKLGVTSIKAKLRENRLRCLNTNRKNRKMPLLGELRDEGTIGSTKVKVDL